jgi:peptidoglycan/LPS O-acetylase OafA/YrhL
VNRQKGYFPTLDGWRALSVIAVVLFHSRDTLFGNSSRVRQVLYHCSMGVDVFFVISGFLICGQLLREEERDGTISLSRFYVRRCFRILPAYYAYLVTICILSALSVLPSNRVDLPSCLLFYRNFMPLGGDVSGGVYTAHFWSLAIEEQFYFFWPMLLLLLKPRRAAKFALLTATALYGWKVMAGHFLWVATLFPPGLNLLSRGDAILWGCVGASYFPAIQRWIMRVRYVQLWLPIAVIVPLTIVSHIPELVSLLSFLLAALVLSTLLQPTSLLGRVLECRPLRWIGTASYSIYLWQELFLARPNFATSSSLFRFLQQPPWSFLAILACACASRYLVELPMTNFGRRLNTLPRPSIRTLPSVLPVSGGQSLPFVSVPGSHKVAASKGEDMGRIAS